jgi:hypothetical protein
MEQMLSKKSIKMDKSNIKHIHIDGQEILFPDEKDWNELHLNPCIDDLPIAVLDSVWSVLKVVQKYPELHLGLGLISLFSEWMPYVFLEIESNFQRVHLETLTCSFCNWRGKTANPMVIDPYFGDGIDRDHFTLMKVAEKYPVLRCPRCNNSLPRHPIWVEPINPF